MPFTRLFLLVYVVVGVVTGAPWQEVPLEVIRRWGFSPRDVGHLHAYTRVTGVVFTRYPIMFWGLLPFIPVTIGVFEWLAGARRALVLYWQTELAGSLGAAGGIVSGMALLGSPELPRYLATADVGMSSGGFGCLGASVQWLPGRARLPVFLLGLVYLVRPPPMTRQGRA